VLYTRDFDEIVNKPVNVILSPQYYWIKKIEIPIRSIYQAKKIAKNMFDLKGEYIYGAIKIKNKFFAYAIEKNLDLKIDKKYIKSLYLAQSELFEYECVNFKNHSLKKIDDLLFCFPRDENCDELDLSKIKLSKNTITLDKINFSPFTLAMIFVFFLLVNIVYITKGFVYKKAISNIESEKIKLTKRYNLPQTSFQLNAIYETLENKYKKIKLLKEDLEFFSATPLGIKERYLNLDFDSKSYNVVINTNKNFDNFFKKRFFVVSSLKNNKYKAKLSHE